MADEEVKATTEETPEVTEEVVTEEKFAKSGKKSKKHIEEVKAEEERQARKVERAKEEAEAEKKPKGAKPVTRPLIERRGKNYRKAHEKIEKGKIYTLAEAMKLAVETNPVQIRRHRRSSRPPRCRPAPSRPKHSHHRRSPERQR